MLKRFGLSVILLCISLSAFSQSQVMRGEISAGSYGNVKTDASGNLYTAITTSGILDPCQSPAVVKTNVAINITTATTTQLVALSGTTTIYVCSFSMTISQVVTTPNTFKFVRGTGASCGTGTADLSGLYGDGGVTAAPPLVITVGDGAMIFKTTAGSALCATTAIGATGSFQGILAYVQQ